MRKKDLRPYLQKHPKILPFFAFLILIFSPILFTIKMWMNEWDDISDEYSIIFSCIATLWRGFDDEDKSDS